MSGKPKPRNARSAGANLLLGIAVFLAMLLLFLRMVVFVLGRGHHHF